MGTAGAPEGSTGTNAEGQANAKRNQDLDAEAQKIRDDPNASAEDKAWAESIGYETGNLTPQQMTARAADKRARAEGSGRYSDTKGKGAGKGTLDQPDLTDKVIRDARNAEFSRLQAKRGRKSQFLVAADDPLAPLTDNGSTLADVTKGY
jgi:hypothetical protein